MNWKSHFSRFLAAAPERLHFAAHSHHPWPDASFDAQQQAWMDAAQLADLKWDKVFGEVIPAAQRHVARLLNLPDPKTLCFAPSTHELVVRLLSTLPARPRVLTTDSEFHSFSRQMKRLEEEDAVQVQRVPVEPYATFAQRFVDAAARGDFDLVYFSHCFFNTGFRVVDVAPLITAVKNPRTAIVIDGYHAFCAFPVDLRALAERVFYTAGGYKYAMAGEGACFLHCPPGFALRPVNTGWFASFGTLTKMQSPGDVPYAEGGQRFMGATFDPTALYRLNAVHDWLQRDGITIAAIRARVEGLQARFLAQRDHTGVLRNTELVPAADVPRGNFLIFRHPEAQRLHDDLLGVGILTDCRADRLRVGFGLYQDEEDVEEFFARAARLEC